MNKSSYQIKKEKRQFVEDRLKELGFTSAIKDKKTKITHYHLEDEDLGFNFKISFNLFRKWDSDGFDLNFIFQDLPVIKDGEQTKISISLLAINLYLKWNYFDNILNPSSSDFDWEVALVSCIEEVRGLKNKLPLNYETDRLLGKDLKRWVPYPFIFS